MLTKTGRCLCGAVKFEAEFAGPRYGACHCGMCRRWNGGPSMSKEAVSLRVTSGAEKIVSYRSSTWAERAFCGTCGAHLWYHFIPEKTHIVAVGALDDQSDMVLASEIYVDHKPPGYAFAGDLKRMTEAEFLASMGAASPPDGG